MTDSIDKTSSTPEEIISSEDEATNVASPSKRSPEQRRKIAFDH